MKPEFVNRGRFLFPSLFYSLALILSGIGFAPLQSLAQDLDDENPVEVSASYRVIQDSDQGVMSIQVKLAEGWYIYSSTQPPGGPLRTKIALTSPAVTLAGDLVANHPPKQVRGEPGFESIVVEKHFEEVQWDVPLKFAQATGNDALAFEIKFSGQVCSNACIPLNKKLPVKFVGMLPPNPKATPAPSATATSATPPASKPPTMVPLKKAEAYRDPKGHVEWQVSISHAATRPGESLTLRIQANPDFGYHVYHVEADKKETNFHTCLVVDEANGLRFGMPTTSSEVTKQVVPGVATPNYFHEGEAVWEIPVTVPADAKPGAMTFSGLVGFQACNDRECDQPLAFRFRGSVAVGDANTATPMACELTSIKFAEVAKSPVRLTWFNANANSNTTENGAPVVPLPQVPKATPPDPSSAMPPNPTEFATSDLDQEEPQFGSEGEEKQSTWYVFLLAIAGGFCLNFMPCVLPVIGLKVMSFMQESDGSNARFAWLNVCYVLGIISIMMLFGGATVIAKSYYGVTVSWGEHFGHPTFRLSMLILIFTMALSFLGVWEIPIPGFATSKTSNALMSKEGAAGAFFKGALTTVLATPCTGPFLGTALSATLSQPNLIILTVFFFIGFGLGLPYILFALFPATKSWLPKPGAWMDTFKQLLAFPLLLTTVFVLSCFPNDYRIAAMTTLMAVWFGCWIIGQIPPYTEWFPKLAGWCSAILLASIGGWLSFQYLGPVDIHSQNHIAWEPYSESRLRELKKEGKTVLIDFTAAWCANCKTNLKFSVETNRVAQRIRQNDVVALIADMTDSTTPEGAAVEAKLHALKCNGIPVLAIYSPKDPKRPRVLRALVSESTVLNALAEAGPSNKR